MLNFGKIRVVEQMQYIHVIIHLTNHISIRSQVYYNKLKAANFFMNSENLTSDYLRVH